jgi:hypothetical protein
MHSKSCAMSLKEGIAAHCTICHSSSHIHDAFIILQTADQSEWEAKAAKSRKSDVKIQALA